MKPRDRVIAFLFVSGTAMFFLGSFRLLHGTINVVGHELPSWSLTIYAAMLFASALLLVFGHRWARIPAALLLAASIWYLAREVFAADYGRIPGGSGPDANPMAGVIYLILGAAAIIGIIATLFLVWLFTLRTPLNK